jgi:hypothetical protein
VNEPRRLASAGDATPLERRLLEAGRARHEPDGMRERVFVAVSAAGTAGVGAVGLSRWLTKGKLTLLSVVLLASAGTFTYLASRPTQSVRRAAVLPVLPVAAPSVAATIEPATPAQPTPASIASIRPARRARAKAPSARTEPSATTELSALREEALLVERARAALARGEASVAASELAGAEARFVPGRLVEEREALTVRVAAALGDAARATRLAGAFLARYPSSPQRPAIEALLASGRKKQ